MIPKNKEEWLFVIPIFALVCFLSWCTTVGFIKLITMCFGLEFSLRIATGIWLITLYVYNFFLGITAWGRRYESN